MKASWASWLALLLASAALIISFVFIGQAKDTTVQLEVLAEAYNATVNEYNEVIAQYNQIADEYRLVVEDYWEWREQQNDT